MAHDVPVQGLGEGVLHALGQTDHLGLLGHHVHQHIGGQALGPVGEPLDQIGVGDGGHPDGPALIVDLSGVVGVLELADHVAEGAHLPVAQVFGGLPVQGGDLVEGDLGDVGGEVAVLHGQQVPISGGPQDGQGEDLAHSGHDDQQEEQRPHRQALSLHEAGVFPEIALGRGLLRLQPEAGGEEGDQGVDDAQEPHEAVEVSGLGVQGGEGHIEVDGPHDRGDGQGEQHPSGPAPGQMVLHLVG